MRTVVVCLFVAVIVIGCILQVLFLSPPARAASAAGTPSVLGAAVSTGTGDGSSPLAWAFPAMRGSPDPGPEPGNDSPQVTRVSLRDDWGVSAAALDAAPLWERMTWLEQRLAQLESGGTGFAPEDTFWMPGRNQDLVYFGDEGHQVLWVQRRLKELGEYYGRMDGIFHDETHQAVINFQTRHGLKVDGIVGPETRARIYQFYIK